MSSPAQSIRENWMTESIERSNENIRKVVAMFVPEFEQALPHKKEDDIYRIKYMPGNLGAMLSYRECGAEAKVFMMLYISEEPKCVPKLLVKILKPYPQTHDVHKSILIPLGLIGNSGIIRSICNLFAEKILVPSMPVQPKQSKLDKLAITTMGKMWDKLDQKGGKKYTLEQVLEVGATRPLCEYELRKESHDPLFHLWKQAY
jgi:hypothetical protein